MREHGQDGGAGVLSIGGGGSAWTSLPTWMYLLSLLGAVVVQLVAVPTPVRSVVVLWFLLVCPGHMAIRRFVLGDRVATLTITAAASVSIDTLVASTLLYGGVWSPNGLFTVLAAACAVDQLALARRAIAGPNRDAAQHRRRRRRRIATSPTDVRGRRIGADIPRVTARDRSCARPDD